MGQPWDGPIHRWVESEFEARSASNFTILGPPILKKVQLAPILGRDTYLKRQKSAVPASFSQIKLQLHLILGGAHLF